jgi:hypothetical protein
VSVTVPRDAAGPTLEGHSRLRGTADGVRVRVSDGDARTAAEALLRWRVELERFGPQLRAASP